MDERRTSFFTVVPVLLDGGEVPRRKALEAILGAVEAFDRGDQGPGTPAADPVLAVLRSQYRLMPVLRGRLKGVLAEAGTRWVGPVLRRLQTCKGRDLRLVLDFAKVLALPDLLPGLEQVIEGEDRFGAVLALQAAGAVDDRRATVLLTKALEREDLRWTAVAMLRRRGIPETMGVLARHLQDPSPEVRLETIGALAGFQDRRLIPYLARVAREDGVPRVRQAAAAGAASLALELGVPLPPEDLQPAVQAGGEQGPLDRWLAEARRQGASDLHLVPGSPPAFRIHGELREIQGPPLTEAECRDLVMSVVPESLREEVVRAMGGDFSHDLPGVGRHRVNVFQERRGWSAVFRLVPTRPPHVRELGLPPQVREAAGLTQGLVLVTGRSGSGKTSTLAALVDRINEARPCHVVMLEDPIEYVHERKRALVNQREIGRHSASFPAALRAALREDPDVIVVGEMRDLLTMRMAIEAAETGHLVLATLHTPTAVGAIQRLIESFPASEQAQVRLMLADSLRLVVAQMLVRRRSGSGRVGVFEVLPVTMAVSALIRENKLAQLLAQMQVGRGEGFRPMDVALAERVRTGDISLEDAVSRAQNPEVLRAAVGGVQP
ncbi:PilT/PilU family type 4a pilus ATPase [Myxococcota bacterium]|nr:PilT/PilU family type 4a pilus ATPase [Myxococcota bacterium]